jgi:DNA-binding ferritin-like protein (Dps family)
MTEHAQPTDWDELRAYFDTVGMQAVENAVAKGTPADVAGQRVAHFNDILIEQLQQQGRRNVQS